MAYAMMSEVMRRWLDGQIGVSGDLMIDVDPQAYITQFEKECGDYCSQNEGDCTTCSLVNHGMDCHNRAVRAVSMAARLKCGLIDR